jgi:hypothetical protein
VLRLGVPWTYIQSRGPWPQYSCANQRCVRSSQLNQQPGGLRAPGAACIACSRRKSGGEAGGALARQAPLALALDLRSSVAVELQETQCRRVVGGARGGEVEGDGPSLPRASCVSVFGGEHLLAG